MTAPAATAGDGLREEWVQGVWGAAVIGRTQAEQIVDRFALPALRDVLAAAARDAEKVRAVRGLIDGEFDYSSLELRRALRRALDPS